MEYLTEQQKEAKIAEIAKKLGIPVGQLLEGKTRDQVIADYQTGRLSVLSE